ncbi:hypothetical protein ACHAW6_013196 [Cyclotella cf. meneghiniana]
MVYHKQEFWKTNTLQNASMNLDIIRESLWSHETHNVQFALVVDNFRVKYTDLQDVDHLT